MDTQQRIDIFEQILSRQLGWVRVIDTRGAFVVTMVTALLATLGTLVSWAGDHVSYCHMYIAVAAAVPDFFALAYVWMAAYPQTTGPKRSMIFFGGIKKLSRHEYVAAAKGIDADTYLEDLAKQCHRNGEIADCKYKLIKSALMWLYFSFATWVIAAFLLFTMSATATNLR